MIDKPTYGTTTPAKPAQAKQTTAPGQKPAETKQAYTPGQKPAEPKSAPSADPSKKM